MSRAYVNEQIQDKLDQAISAATGLSLAEAFSDFARAFYYQDLWRAALLPELAGSTPTVQPLGNGATGNSSKPIASSAGCAGRS